MNFSCVQIDNSEANSKVGQAELEVNKYAIAFEKDIARFCELVESKYYYFEKAESYWDEACETATRSVSEVKDNWQGLVALEVLADQLYESHLGFNKNLRNSARLIPSGADLWVEQLDDSSKIIITALRFNGAAAKAGIKVNDEFISLNGLSAEQLIQTRMQFGLQQVSDTRKQWALNAALAGNRAEARDFIVKRNTDLMEFSLDAPEPPDEPGNVQYKLLESNVAYVRFSNSLGNSQTVQDFAQAVMELRDAKAWILDLRNTNGGGNTSVAEPIMGHFYSEETLYQKTVYQNGELYLPVIKPHVDLQIRAPLVVLVGRWTGSMGEGMAIGFDGTDRGVVIGTKMARLAGGTENFLLENTNTGVSFPTYDLQHLDGTSRHHWEPSIQVSSDNGNEQDLVLAKAMEILNN